MQLAHAGDDGLAGLSFVGPYLEGGVLLGETLDSGTEALLVGLALRLDGHRDDRGGERHRLENDRLGVVAQRVTGGRVLEAHHGHDHAGDRVGLFFALVRVHLEDLADSLLTALGRVEHGGTGLKRSGVQANVGELAEVRVAHDLEGKSREGLILVRLTLDLGLVANVVTGDRVDVERAGQVADHGVEHGLDALVLEG